MSLGRLRHYVAITQVSRNAPMCVLIACLDVSSRLLLRWQESTRAMRQNPEQVGLIKK